MRNESKSESPSEPKVPYNHAQRAIRDETGKVIGFEPFDKAKLKSALKEVKAKNKEVRDSFRLTADKMDFRAGKSESPLPHGFCATPGSKCTMNYCDENGCNDRKRELTEPSESPLISERSKTNNMKTGIELITEERREQIEKHGRTVEDDAKYNKDCEMALAAQCILMNDDRWWPEAWDRSLYHKMMTSSYKKRLMVAGALIAAEIDRLNHEVK